MNEVATKKLELATSLIGQAVRAMEQAILEGDGDRTFIIPQKCELIKIANKLFNHVHPPIRKSREARKDAL